MQYLHRMCSQDLVGKITGSANDAAGQAKGAASDAAGSAKGAAAEAKGKAQSVAKNSSLNFITMLDLPSPQVSAQEQQASLSCSSAYVNGVQTPFGMC